ncbi:MAG: PilZ domain-containing protein [Nitrospiraceae bacterium]|nr:MAG: PilZ domain-containing protein [Nitrospiraceae bacterium]
MEKRNAKRIVGGYKAEIIYEGKSYEGIIDDLSETGVGLLTGPLEDPLEVAPGMTLELRFHPLSGEMIILQCRVKWLQKAPPHGLKMKMGLEILNPPWDMSGSFL